MRENFLAALACHRSGNGGLCPRPVDHRTVAHLRRQTAQQTPARGCMPRPAAGASGIGRCSHPGPPPSAIQIFRWRFCCCWNGWRRKNAWPSCCRKFSTMTTATSPRSPDKANPPAGNWCTAPAKAATGQTRASTPTATPSGTAAIVRRRPVQQRRPRPAHRAGPGCNADLDSGSKVKAASKPVHGPRAYRGYCSARAKLQAADSYILFRKSTANPVSPAITATARCISSCSLRWISKTAFAGCISSTIRTNWQRWRRGYLQG